ncbi:hypothetical protein SAMN06265222_1162 [Neorhodopirellula lusitana]|uniref:HEAT repeat domain-containing protein n=1 Tax=Neorhodopirellula lusitana TaxID=445327 RepID=A0ABY1QLL5_9BACT|nr:hypothetical protein [Neorhodopirellula lusitana]SMP73040.1 hypothetical protein SAMN06265222_1162 [Neorhodopirellula lusitana]
MFFQPKANLSDSAKSRIEFCLQQIAECIGFERLLLPVVSRKAIFDLYEVERDPQQVIAFVGKHLEHDVNGIQVRNALPQAQSAGGGCCGGGSCDGPSGLAGRYEPSDRSITLDQTIDSDPAMGLATLINAVVCDLLSQNSFAGAQLPEQVDLAVVGTGLGMIRNGISLVAKHPVHWDSTQWDVFPRPFLDGQSLAYANAIAAWARDDQAPKWSSDLPSDLKRPMRKSLKFLLKTNDSFFQPRAKQFLLTQSQSEWWKLATDSSASSQVIAIRHLNSDGKLDDQQESLLIDKLGSANVAITLNAISAIERMASQQPAIGNESMVRELRSLTDHRDDEVCAKSMCVLAKLGGLDEATVETAATMLDAHQKHLTFAGLYALCMQDSVPEEVVPALDRCFVRVLRACDYELIDLIATAYRRLLDDPQSHMEELFQNSPEHLPIALETLQKVSEPRMPLRRGA